MKIRTKGLLLLTAVLLCELMFVFFQNRLLRSAELEADREAHFKSALSNVNKLLRVCYEAPLEFRNYAVTRNKAKLEHFDKNMEDMELALDWLKSNLKPEEWKRFATVDRDVRKGREIMLFLRNALDSAGTLELIELSHSVPEELDPLLKRVLPPFLNFRKYMEDEESEVPLRQRQLRDQQADLLSYGVAANVLIAVLVGVLFMRAVTSRLDSMVENTGRLSEGKALLPLLTGTDEINLLDTAFHTMAEKLDEASRKERAVVEHAVDVIFSLDPQGRFGRVSPASTKVWGRAPEELLTHPYAEIVHVDDLDFVQRSIDEVKAGKDGSFETRISRPDGSFIYSLWSASWVQSENSLFCVAHDISERKRAEELLKESEARWRLIIETMPVGLVLLDTNGQIHAVNKSLENMFGAAREHLVGAPVKTLFPGVRDFEASDLSGIYPRYLRKIAEFNASKLNGDLLPVEFSLEEFSLSDGSNLLGIMLDVTERYEIQKMRQAFVAMVSHDLRTPLTGVKAFLELLRAGAVPAEQIQQKAFATERSVKRLIALINDLLDLEKMEAGQLALSIGDVNVDALMDQCIEAVSSFAEQHEVELDFPVSSRVIKADGDRLVQVLVNLLSNAIKFSPPGETVEVVLVEAADFIEFRVLDHGRGVPASHRETIFERFKQVETTDATRKGGTGLGLAICKAIVVQHGGTIGVDSEEGKGSQFWFRLPS